MELNNLIASNSLVDIYQNGDTVVKLFKEDLPKTNALYESLTHARVESTGLPVPKIKEVSVIDGRWAIHMDYIKGKTLADLMKEDPKNASEYIEKFIDLQLLVHAQTTPKLSKLKDKLSRQINSLTCIDAIKRYDLLTRLDSKPKHTKLCHGNFTPENIIVNDGKTYIVDWMHARQGNASADVGRTYLLLNLQHPEIADEYLDLFCQKTATSKRYVQEWLPIVAAAQLIMNPVSENERDLLMQWIDVVEYE